MNDSATTRPSVARIWRGRTPRDRADEYEAYYYEAGIRPLIDKALGVQAFRGEDCQRLLIGLPIAEQLVGLG